jgi:hypothetical protein
MKERVPAIIVGNNAPDVVLVFGLGGWAASSRGRLPMSRLT